MRIKLKGSSGVSILFKNNKGIKIVRKQSEKKEQIDRLKVQYSKHIFLSKLNNDLLRSNKPVLFNIPQIISSGNEGGNFFYEYKFVEGVSLSEALSLKSTNQLIKLIDKLVLIIKYFSTNSEYFELSYENRKFEDVLTDKIVNVCNILNLDSSIKNKLLSKLSSVNIPTNKTLCHGDLSFENIIVDKKDNIWLIDCIGTFYPHYWTDLSKLFQDIEGEWYSLKHKVKPDRFKNKQLTNYLKKRINEFDKDYIKSHNFFMAMIFLRILPYLKDQSKQKKILRKINSYLDKKSMN
ncbi:hypothetical protein HYW41_01975 [Candidatus Daviesbacteria bacterium]|nr:hypothetical protein [Candidatus Daviesbacteria bacterium]